MLVVSPSLPIKFFATGEQTFNEKIVDGIQHKNYFHDLKCDEIQRLLGFEKFDPGVSSINYKLSVIEKGIETGSQDFVKSSTGIGATIPFVATTRPKPPLDFSPDWNVVLKQVTVSALFPTWYIDFAIVGGVANIDTDFFIPFNFAYIAGVGSPGPVKLKYYVYNSDFSLSAEVYGISHTGNGDYDETITFNVAFTPAYFSIRAEYFPNFLSDEDCFITIKPGLTITSTYSSSVIYSNDFIPSDFGLCGKCAVLQIRDKDTEDILYRTDPLNFKSSLYMSVAIQYKQSKSFAGIPYTVDTDYLTARFKGIFYKERPQEEQKVINLSDRTITSANFLKKQKKAYICTAPYYIHDMVKLILMHSAGGSVLIDGIEFTKQEAYEYIEYVDQYAWVAASCWISKKQYLYRDVLS